MFAKGDYRGEGVGVEGALDLTPQSLERARDALMVRLQKRGVPARAIARLVGLHHSNVVRRLNSIPPKVRERYEKIEILGL